MAGPRRWKSAVLKMHRWIALSFGLLLMLNASTGLLLLGSRLLEDHTHPQLFKVQPQATKVSLESIRQALQAEVGPTQNLTLWPAHAPDESMSALVRGEDGWEGQIFIDPYSGRRLGARDRYDFGLNGVLELHTSLLSGKNGKAVLGLMALSMFVMLLSGLYMWWPIRWRMAFKVTLAGGRIRSLFDLHRVGGAVLGLWVMVAVTTGGLLAYRPAAQWINLIAGAEAIQPPKLTVAKGGAPVPLDVLVQKADAVLPGGEVGAIVVPAKTTQPMRVRKKVDGDPHPIGLSAVWMNPLTAEVLRIDRWGSLPPTERMFAWVYPLHSGRLGGVLSVAFTAIAGMALLGFGVTGTWLWWLRRKNRPQAQPRTAAASAR